MGRRKWSRTDIERMFDMRDVQRMKWADIADALDDTVANCCARYSHYFKKRYIQALRRGETPAERQSFVAKRKDAVAPKVAPVRRSRAVAGAAPNPEPPPKPVRKPEPVIHRPRYFHEADADIAARIRRQGLTAGFLGDPPPGRSALDQRRG